MGRFFTVLGRLVVRFRYLVVAFWLVLVVITAGFPSLSSEVNNDNSQFLPASTPSSRAATLAAPILGSVSRNSEVAIVAAREDGRLDSADQALLARVIADVRAVSKVDLVRELGASPDGKAVQILVRARINQADIRSQKTLIAELEAALARAGAPPGLQLKLAGEVATNVANQASSERTGKRTQLFSLLFIIVLLLLIFRALLAPVITLLPAGLSLLVSMRVIGELGAHGLKISEITELLLIILILGAGTDYGLFLVFRVREEMRRGLDGKAAVEHALVRVGESITASAGTVILALLTLLLASFGIYRDLGVPLAIGVGIILLAGLTLLPALLAIFGKAAFWPTRVGPGDPRDGVWGRIAARLVRRPVADADRGGRDLRGSRAGGPRLSLERLRRRGRRPSGQRRRCGKRTRGAPFPAVELQPGQPDLPLRDPGLAGSDPGRPRRGGARGLAPVHGPARSPRPQRREAHSRARSPVCTGCSGTPRGCPRRCRPGLPCRRPNTTPIARPPPSWESRGM